MMGVRGGFRRLVAYIAVILSLAFPATARQVTAEERREADLFILGNTLFILYHELGHALIDLLGLPVLGHEEDAADNLASIMMIPDQPDPVMDELIVAAADGWYLGDLWQQEAGNAEPSWWGEHSLDMQRFYSVVCLMYGSDPAGFAELADSVNLPSDRRTSCAGDYQQARAGWSRLLEPPPGPAHASRGDPRGPAKRRDARIRAAGSRPGLCRIPVARVGPDRSRRPRYRDRVQAAARPDRPVPCMRREQCQRLLPRWRRRRIRLLRTRSVL